jgi:hypothetical protein
VARTQHEWRKEDMLTRLAFENYKGRSISGDFSIDEAVIVKWTLQK